MKKSFYLLLVFFVGTTALYSQDVILKNDGSEIICKINEIGDSELKYTLKNNKDLKYVISLSDILLITFENGDKIIPKNIKSTPSNIIIPTGTNILLEVKQLLSAKTAIQGQVFSVIIKQDVFDETGKILLFKAGTLASGTVTGVTKNKSLGRPGTLAISVDKVRAVDGVEVPVSLNFSDKGEDRSGAAIGVGALLFWPALFIKGEAPEIPAGMILRAETITSHTLSQL